MGWPCGQPAVHPIVQAPPRRRPCHHHRRAACASRAGEGDVRRRALRRAPRHRVGDRPWVGLCMIASLDGSTVVAGKSGGLSNPDDVAVLATLRRAADAIVVGASTVRQEGYGPPKKAGQRIGVVSASGNVDPASELFRSGAGFLIMPEDGPPPPRAIEVVRAGRGRVDLALALARLDEVMARPDVHPGRGRPSPQRVAARCRLHRRARPDRVTHPRRRHRGEAHGRRPPDRRRLRPRPRRRRRSLVPLHPLVAPALTGQPPVASLPRSSISRWKSAAASKFL